MAAEEAWEGAPTQDLLAAAQGGERAALEALFTRYHPRVLALAHGRLGRPLRRALDSEDLVQEALGEAARDLARFEWRGESSLIRWLARVVEHRVNAHADRMNALKRDVRRDVALEDASDALRRSTETGGPLLQAARNEEEERVRAALDQLPERQRESILLRDYAGCSWEEVAEELALASPDAARMLHVRALTRLGKLLGEGG